MFSCIYVGTVLPDGPQTTNAVKRTAGDGGPYNGCLRVKSRATATAEMPPVSFATMTAGRYSGAKPAVKPK